MVWDVVAERVREGRMIALPRGENFLKQGIMVHSEQIVKGGGGHWICVLLLCKNLNMRAQSELFEFVHTATCKQPLGKG